MNIRPLCTSSARNGGDGMKRSTQLLSILPIVALFAAFNLSIYTLVTSRCGGLLEGESRADAIDVSDYIPFDENAAFARLSAPASLSLEDDLPVLDGAAALLPVYASFANAVYPNESCTFDGEDYTADSAMQFRNTLRAYKAIVDGDADIVFCAAPSEAQRAYADEQGVELTYTPIGREAFVFLVNEHNPVDSLTVEQIRGIYRGEYHNWNELGGADRLINPLERIEGSGSQSALVSFLGSEPTGKHPLGLLGASIGFSFRYYTVGILQNTDVKLLSVNGVYPDEDNIRSGAYPITVEFYAVTRTDDDRETTRAMLDWILSEEGQQLIEQSGYVGIG